MECCLGCEWVRDRGNRGVIAWKIWNGTELGDVEGIMVEKFQPNPRLEMWAEIWSENFSWIPAGASGLTFPWRL